MQFMRSVGDGSSVWRVRVDLFAPDGDAHRVEACAASLRSLLVDDGEREVPCEIAVDGGTGIERRPVLGLLFWVRADDVGEAARTAVATAVTAGAGIEVGPELYDVVVIPHAAVARPGDPLYPAMPD